MVSNALQGQNTTTITESKDGKEWKIKANADAKVDFKKDKDGAVDLSVNNQGKPSPISEAIAGVIVLGAQKTDIRIDGD